MPSLGQAFAQDIALLKQSGVNPVVIHGGGPQIGGDARRRWASNPSSRAGFA
jgi:acetylglutamate kinase